MTNSDQAIEEVRRSRCRMSDQCGHDVTRLIELLHASNQRYAAQVREYRARHGEKIATDGGRG